MLDLPWITCCWWWCDYHWFFSFTFPEEELAKPVVTAQWLGQIVFLGYPSWQLLVGIPSLDLFTLYLTLFAIVRLLHTCRHTWLLMWSVTHPQTFPRSLTQWLLVIVGDYPYCWWEIPIVEHWWYTHYPSFTTAIHHPLFMAIPCH